MLEFRLRNSGLTAVIVGPIIRVMRNMDLNYWE